MTTYYKGNNIGLNYDASAGTWSFSNLPQDFIDPNSFSSPDPVFPTAPTEPTTPTDPTPDPCPPGYVYDETLQQCVPDPNVEPDFLGNQQVNDNTNPPVKIAGTDRYTTDNNFIATDAEYDDMTAEEFVENYKQRGMVGKDENGNLFIDLSKMSKKGSILDSLYNRLPKDPVTQEKIRKGEIPGQVTEAEASVRKSLKYIFDKNIAHGDLNPDLFNFKPLGMGTVDSENFPLTKLFEKDKENYKIILPTKQSKSNTVVGATGTNVVGGWGDKIFDTSYGIYSRENNIIPNNPFTETLNKWANYANLTTNASTILQNRLDSESVLKEEKIKQEQIKTERERNKLANELDAMIKAKDDERKEKNKKDMQQTIKDAEEEKKLRDDLSQDISSQVPGSAFTGSSTSTSGTGGNTLGSSVHGTGSYNPNMGSSSSSNQVHTGSLGSSVHGTGSHGNVASEERKTCFHPEQLIGNKFIKDLEPGDLINDVKILGMVKLKLDEDMYSLNNVKVTGTHKVKYNNNWIYVSEHPDSFVINDKPEFVYVPIVEGGTFIINNYEFADYDDEHIETLNNKLKVA